MRIEHVGLRRGSGDPDRRHARGVVACDQSRCTERVGSTGANRSPAAQPILPRGLGRRSAEAAPESPPGPGASVRRTRCVPARWHRSPRDGRERPCRPLPCLPAPRPESARCQNDAASVAASPSVPHAAPRWRAATPETTHSPALPGQFRSGDRRRVVIPDQVPGNTMPSSIASGYQAQGQLAIGTPHPTGTHRSRRPSRRILIDSLAIPSGRAVVLRTEPRSTEFRPFGLPSLSRARRDAHWRRLNAGTVDCRRATSRSGAGDTLGRPEPVGCEFQFKPPSVVEISRGRKTSSGSHRGKLLTGFRGWILDRVLVA